jgi:hypothetical protein
MPSSLDKNLGLLGYWPDDMPSSHLDPWTLLGILAILAILDTLAFLAISVTLTPLGNLNALNPEPIDLPLHMLIEEEDT